MKSSQSLRKAYVEYQDCVLSIRKKSATATSGDILLRTELINMTPKALEEKAKRASIILKE